MAEQEDGGVYLPIEWYYPENTISRYANNILVQHTETEFIVSFFEIQPPTILGSAEDVKTQLEEVKSVRATCVARIIVPISKMPSFIEALESNHKKYLSKLEEQE